MLKIVITQKEADTFKKASRMDKMRLCVEHRAFEHHLNGDDSDYFLAVQWAFPLLPEASTVQNLTKRIQENIRGFENPRTAKTLAETVTYAYADALKNNKKVDNYFYVQFQQRLADKAAERYETTQDPKHLEIASKIAERAALAGGYDRPSEGKERAKIPEVIVVTSDQRVLKAQQHGASTDDPLKLLADGT